MSRDGGGRSELKWRRWFLDIYPDNPFIFLIGFETLMYQLINI
ncbi:hypothetical protein [Vibrio gallaecicus]|nr:hypothetical protein [Vibrio gallaecicus]MDN3613937.1 hypothetical protein [Vibrio gallaecicus]